MQCFRFALLAVGPTFAQTFRGTILGAVSDSSGAAVPGATVTIKNLDTGLTRTVSTSDDGSYSAPELPIGNYSATAEKAGFKSSVVSGVKVEVSSERRIDFTLQPGQLAQTVQVQADELPMVESTSNTLGGILESKVVTTLPVNGGDYQKLIFLVPGVTGSPDQITDSPGSFGIFSVNGARGRANNFLLDGTDMNDGYRNDPAINEAGVFGTPATILPISAIDELHVASNFEAEYGRSAGGVVNIVTKSGGNQFHGAASEFFRNNALDARNFFNDTSLPQNPFHANQFAGSLGGPIVKDNTFFFIDYEGNARSWRAIHAILRSDSGGYCEQYARGRNQSRDSKLDRGRQGLAHGERHRFLHCFRTRLHRCGADRPGPSHLKHGARYAVLQQRQRRADQDGSPIQPEQHADGALLHW